MKKISNFLLASLFALVICSTVLSQDFPSTGNNSNILKRVTTQFQTFDGNGYPTTMTTTPVVIGNNSTSGNGRAPQGTRRFNNSKYIISGAEMTASGFTGPVTSVGWRWNVASPPAAGPPASQSTSTTGNIRVYLKDTLGSAVSIGGTFIDTTGAGYTKIIDGTITIPSGLAEINIDVPAGGPGTSSYTPTPGSGVILIYVYKTTTATLPTPLGAPSCFCTTVGGTLLTYQSQTAGGSVGTASSFRPETRFGVATFADDMGVSAFTANPPSPACVGATEIFTATANNFGTNTQAAGVPVILNIDGIDIETKFTTTSLVSNATENIVFTSVVLTPGSHVIKSFTQLAGDQNPANDSKTIPYLVLNTISTFPYLETFATAPGWTVSGAGSLWLLQSGVTNPSGGTDAAAKCDFFNSAAGNAAILRSPPLDFTGVSNPVIYFYTAYRTFATENDSLQVLISTDCGITFSDVPVAYRRSENSSPSLATLAPNTTAYIPSSTGQWRHETVDLSAYANNPDVIIGFRGRSAFGNNLFIDDFIATNTDAYCSSAVTAPGAYACNPLVNVNFTTVGLNPTGNLTSDNYASNITKTFEENSSSINAITGTSNNPVIKSGNTSNDNPGGGALSVSQHNNYPPTTAAIEIATNTTATSPDGSIYTPSIIYSKNWYTTTYTGNDKSGYALYDISIDLNGLTFTNPDSLYILKRADMTGSWEVQNTTRTGSILKVSGLNDFSDFALAGNSRPCPNPAIPTIAVSNGVLHHVWGPHHDLTPVPLGCGTTGIVTPYDPGNPGAYYMTFDILASDPDLAIIGSTEMISLNVTMSDVCNTLVVNPTVPTPYQNSDILAHVIKTPICDEVISVMTITATDLCGNQAVCHLTFEKPLPVELASFASLVNRNDVTLNWSTASEINNSGFDVERSIVNNQTSNVWNKVGNVVGNGTTTNGSNYSFNDRNVASGKYNYRLKQIDINGNFEYFNLSNEVNVGTPTKFELSQNYPNPFNPSTKINFALPNDGKVSLKIYDMSGKEVMTLVNEVKTAGYYSVNFNASSLSSGVYFYSISADNFTATKKMMLIK